ncbi:tRNA (adenosine(37)-N6)-dimethylallyltransferase MiaA [uncultured Alistipes sp.]|uniref:tRNA (adenosine(37)-N6)-dimethylallyltransferase MiaA n=1 Tax=uncultured Alistipes sp. TaxID=538949 RepID=UPI0026210BB1|nr:tRNA (adenosine(37)-N6)-dimethylallyltransferase MiaA [uncultured Alistipes sp.]
MTTSTKRLIVIVGPTGSGKTDLSIRIARRYGAPVLSTDSRQMYRGMAVGTAQPSPEQLQEVEHHFIASHDIKDNLSCGEYETQALARLDELFAAHDYVVAVGGSGLYVRALCEGMDDLPQADEELRRELASRLATEGLESLAAQLKTLDPAFYDKVDRSNPARVVRALEVCLQTGLPYSQLRTGTPRPRSFGIVKVGVDMPRDMLYERIDRRVDCMLADGLEAEARALYPYRHLNALQTVGYREFFDYFDGRTTYDEAVALIKRNSRRYAKRQLTWFRRDGGIRWFGPDDTEAIISYIDFGES